MENGKGLLCITLKLGDAGADMFDKEGNHFANIRIIKAKGNQVRVVFEADKTTQIIRKGYKGGKENAKDGRETT